MPRAREGSLEYTAKGYDLRVFDDAVQPDGEVKRVRKRVHLHTHDELIAKKLKAEIMRRIDAGDDVLAVQAEDVPSTTVEEFASAHVQARIERGVAMAPDEMINLKKHVF